MKLTVLSQTFTVCRLDAGAAIPAWASQGNFFSTTRTNDELSVVCESSQVPANVKSEKDWRAFKVQGPLEFSLTGILAALANPLAQAGISIFAVSTFDTDYVLVKSENLDAAISTLTRAGHEVY